MDANGDVIHTFDPFTDASSDSVHVLDISGYTDARYVRINHSNEFLHVSEVQVFGSLVSYQDGGVGNDALLGSIGTDEFVFARDYDQDTISGFEDNIDTLSLSSDLGLTNVLDAMGYASQIGNDVHFDFGSGDTLLVLDTTIADIQDDISII